jgi:hypothetical protein
MKKNIRYFLVQALLIISLTSCFHEDPDSVEKKMYKYLNDNQIESHSILFVSRVSLNEKDSWWPDYTWTGVALSSKYDGFYYNLYYDEVDGKVKKDDYREKLIKLKKSLYEIDTIGSHLDLLQKSIKESFINEYLNYDYKIIAFNDFEVALEFYIVKSIDENNKDEEMKNFMNNFNTLKLGLIKVVSLNVKYFSENKFNEIEVGNSLINYLMYNGNQCGMLYWEEKDFKNPKDSIEIKILNPISQDN